MAVETGAQAGGAAQAGPGSARGTAISVSELTKRYGDIEAVRGIDFEVARGETFGFLGPNGAGKSTTISILCTLIRPTSGRAVVAGHDVATERDTVRRNIGLVFQDTTLDSYLTAEQNLRFHADLYGVPKAAVAPRMRQVLEMVGLWDRRESLVRTYSGGMQRRLEIARGLLHAPHVLFLDEPTVGLDPQTRSSIWRYINELKQREDITLILAGLAGVPYNPVLIVTLIGELLLLSFTLTAFGVMMAARIKQFQAFMALTQMLVMPLFFLSGALYPLNGLPAWLTVLTRIDPLTYIVAPMRRAVFSHLNISPAAVSELAPGVSWAGWVVPVGLSLAIVAVMGIAMVVVAVLEFSKTE